MAIPLSMAMLIAVRCELCAVNCFDFCGRGALGGSFDVREMSRCHVVPLCKIESWYSRDTREGGLLICVSV